MGWSSGSYIFAGVANELIKQIEWGYCQPEAGRDILAALILQLRERDWDTEDESFHEYYHIGWVVDAFEIVIPGITKKYDLA